MAIINTAEVLAPPSDLFGDLKLSTEAEQSQQPEQPEQSQQQEKESSVKFVFENAEEFALIHKEGTEHEFANELGLLLSFNTRNEAFPAYPIMRLAANKADEQWILLFDPGELANPLLPREGETFRIRLCDISGKKTFSVEWGAERIDSPCSILERPDWSKYHAYRVTVPLEEGRDFSRLGNPIIDMSSPWTQPANVVLDDNNRIHIKLHLTSSKSTMKSELRALEKLVMRLPGKGYQKQYEAFDYILSFKEPAVMVNLFDTFPHMRNPTEHGVPDKLAQRVKNFNAHQLEAYHKLLSNIPCGLAILPGGPGAGKTHWNLTVAALAQAKPVKIKSLDGEEITRSAKVVYIIDINKALDDVANKMVKLYANMGMDKQVIRMYGWHHELNTSEHVKRKDTQQPDVRPDFSGKFVRIVKMAGVSVDSRRQIGCMAPTLDEAAWKIFDKQKDSTYKELAAMLKEVLEDPEQVFSEMFKDRVYELYQEALRSADFIATTPVAASQYFYGMFIPDIVFFDEAPHARELTNLVAIANFSPVAWIFTGDHRQTRPFVGSKGGTNPHAAQLQTPMMLRAQEAGAIKYSLLINHRAYGNMQYLPSWLFYECTMVSGNAPKISTPRPVLHLQQYLSKYRPRNRTSRILVQLKSRKWPLKVGTSFWNPEATGFVMARVQELLRDPEFVQMDGVSPGKILVIAPYKEAFHRYEKAIQDLPQDLKDKFGAESRVEARTVDTVQGHEADFVFLDFVRDCSTDFLDDPNRLCVALTRARQAEMLVMHPNLRTSKNFPKTKYLREMCTQMGLRGEVARA